MRTKCLFHQFAIKILTFYSDHEESNNMKKPFEKRPTFNFCNSSLARSILYHMYYKIDQHDSSSCKGTFGLLHFMWSNTVIFAVLKG